MRSENLPSPPTDLERDQYFERKLWLLIPLAILSVIGTTLSMVKFSMSHAPWYLLVVVLALAWELLSFGSIAGTRSARAEDHRRKVDEWEPGSYPSMDVLLPVCGENVAVLRNTWMHVSRLQWPGTLKVTVLDDGGDPALERVARGFGFDYMARPDSGWFKKAGNLRYGFAHTDGDWLTIFDADFCPRPDFITELMPYAEDGVGIVQSPQFFRVLPTQGWLERGAGGVQEYFYRVVQNARDSHRASICVGTNAIYRRCALEPFGGTVLVERSEDVHTGLEVRSDGWQVRYVPAILATGLCPDSPAAYFNQQYRWCFGSVSLSISRKFWDMRMSLITRSCYLAGFLYYLCTALFVFMFPVVPLVLLVFAPNSVTVRNYLLLLPAIVGRFVVYPLWHRARYRWEPWCAQLFYACAHVCALIDLVRGKPMGWVASGSSDGGTRVDRVRMLLGLFGGAAAVAWIALAAFHFRTEPLAFAPMLAFGLIYGATVAHVGTLPRPSLSFASGRRKLALSLALFGMLVLLTVPAVGHTAALRGPVFGFGTDARGTGFTQWKRAIPQARYRMTFVAWTFNSSPKKIFAIDKRLGTTPMITWEPWKPPPFGATNQGKPQPRYSNGRIAAGKFDGYIRRWARATKAYKRPVLIRYAHEMEGNWYPWAGDPVSYVKAWRHVWKVFRSVHANNVVWVWSPNVDAMYGQSGALGMINPYYPGGKYVDAISMSLVAFNAGRSPENSLRFMSAYSAYYKKPAFLAETNVRYDVRLDWMDRLRTALAANPSIRGMIWTQLASRQAAVTGESMDWDARSDPVVTADLADIARSLNR